MLPNLERLLVNTTFNLQELKPFHNSPTKGRDFVQFLNLLGRVAEAKSREARSYASDLGLKSGKLGNRAVVVKLQPELQTTRLQPNPQTF